MKYTPFTERHGGDAWGRFEAALNRYFDAEIAVLEAARDRALAAAPVREGEAG